MDCQVSIIVPYKNIANSLLLLLSSIFKQAIPFSVQVIVVDDNSTNNLAEYQAIVDKFQDRVLFLKNTSGVYNAGAARNIGLNHATGKWLLFADSDDSFVDGWEQIINNYLSSDYDIIYFTPTSRDEKGNLGNRHLTYYKLINNCLKKPNNKNLNAVRYNIPVPWSKLIRHEIITKNNIAFDEIMHSNDVMFSMQSSYFANKICVQDLVIYCVNYRTDSLSEVRSDSSFYQRGVTFCKRYNYLKLRLSKKEFHDLSLNKQVQKRITSGLYSYLRRTISKEDFAQLVKLYRDNRVPIIINPFYIFYLCTRKAKYTWTSFFKR